MITLYTGPVGCGKSYHAVELVLEWLSKGQRVIANFPLRSPERYLSKWHKRRWESMLSRFEFCDEITVPYLIAKSVEWEIMGKESACVVIIDEAGIMFNSRDWQVERGNRMKWIKWLSQSRKFGYDLIFVCQSDRMIDRQIRGLVEYEVKHLVANHSFMFRWLSLFRVKLFMYVYRWYQTKLKANLRLSVLKRSVANRYDTMRTFNLDELVTEIEKIYDGAIVPAPVLIQLEVWRDELDKRMDDREKT